MNVSVNVTEVEPRWLLVSFNGEKPPGDSRAFWLSKALTEWLAKNPNFAVARTLPIQHEVELVALHVWLTISPAEKDSLTV